jgi:hypothetical protein
VKEPVLKTLPGKIRLKTIKSAHAFKALNTIKKKEQGGYYERKSSGSN